MSTAANIPWIEKYRPKSIEEVAAQTEIVKVLKSSLHSDNLSHMLFYGPPGTGKTSTILALARDIFGHDHYKQRVLELNASDERGIAVVREKIKNFAKSAVAVNNKLPPYKIIVLDEADSMTTDAQAALRRIMEQYSKITRFCLVCNYVSRIIEPIASRCAKFRFTPLPVTDMTKKLEEIASAEGLSVAPDTLPVLIQASQGDMRRAVMYLQSCSHLGATITRDVIAEIAGLVPDRFITDLISAWKSKSFPAIKQALSEMTYLGYSGGQIMEQFFDMIVTDTEISDLDKSKLSMKFMAADRCLNEGCDEELQLLRLVC